MKTGNFFGNREFCFIKEKNFRKPWIFQGEILLLLWFFSTGFINFGQESRPEVQALWLLLISTPAGIRLQFIFIIRCLGSRVCSQKLFSSVILWIFQRSFLYNFWSCILMLAKLSFFLYSYNIVPYYFIFYSADCRTERLLGITE